MSWKVTIDQITPNGSTQHYEDETKYGGLQDAINNALKTHRMEQFEVGQYQITVTHRLDDWWYTHDRS